MQPQTRVLVVDAAPERWPPLDDRLRARGLQPVRYALGDVLLDTVHTVSDLAILLVEPQTAEAAAGPLTALLEKLVGGQVSTIVWGLPGGLPGGAGPLVEWLAPDASVDEVLGKVGTLRHYVPLLRAFDRELEHLRRLGEQLNHYFNEIDQEMRLAGRLQRDFLPRQLPNLPPYSFDAIYRPASWVSGDMYDAFRIDEHHVGLFIADAMGHGVAAGLLTMFLRQALTPKRVSGNTYTIVRPSEALDGLNQCLVRQRLPNCQFVTAAYGIVDMRSGELCISRAGHPYALHIDTRGRIAEIRGDGSLLGLSDLPAEFEETRVTLAPGDKLVLYTDGLEDTLLLPRTGGIDQVVFTPQFEQWARQPAADFMNALRARLDCEEGSLHPADDMTMLTMEIAPAAQAQRE